MPHCPAYLGSDPADDDFMRHQVTHIDTYVKRMRPLTDKKENQIFLIYEEILNGAVAKSYMTNGLLVYGEIFAHFLIY